MGRAHRPGHWGLGSGHSPWNGWRHGPGPPGPGWSRSASSRNLRESPRRSSPRPLRAVGRGWPAGERRRAGPAS